MCKYTKIIIFGIFVKMDATGMKKICADIVMGAIRLLALLPLRFHYALCGCLAWLMRSVLRYRRKVVASN